MAKTQTRRTGRQKSPANVRGRSRTRVASAAVEELKLEDEDGRSEADEVSFGPLAALIGYRIRRAYGLVFYTFNEMFEPLGIAFGQYSVLALIGLNPGISQMALADASDIDRSTVVPITDRFVRLGWVRRTRRREDRRMYSLRVTPAGQEILDRANKLIIDHDERITKNLSKEERRQLMDLLARINDESIADLRPQVTARSR
jgi:DNA-binding MarR family transcriptional regulator